MSVLLHCAFNKKVLRSNCVEDLRVGHGMYSKLVV